LIWKKIWKKIWNNKEKGMKCLILAAGYATRLYPLTENYPKPLLDVGGKPILDWLVEDISTIKDIDGFVVVTNHKFAGHFKEWAAKKTDISNISIEVVDDGTDTNETRLGAVKDIDFARSRLGIDDDLFVIAGDNMLDFSFAGFIEFAKKSGTSCVMCHEENNLEKQQKTAIITFDETGLITSYEEKPIKPKGNYAVPPFYYYLKEDLDKIPQALGEGCSGDAPGSFAAWLSKNTKVHAYVMSGKRYDIGDLKSYNEVNAIFS
jgi:glucose-1-phosphate thymidylyltransferase